MSILALMCPIAEATFTDRRTRKLKGISEEWQVYERLGHSLGAEAMVLIQLIEQRAAAAVRAAPRSITMPSLVALPYPRSARLHGGRVSHVLRTAKGSAWVCLRRDTPAAAS
jgi:hypothetical protein